MTNIAVIENKISSIRKYLKILERYNRYSAKQIEEDLDIRGAVERYLYLVIQSTIDLAEAIIAYKDFRKPTTMSEAFHILKEEKIIPPELTERMTKMVGFRNIIAHDYEEIKYEIVYEVLHKGLKDINIFIEKVSRL